MKSNPSWVASLAGVGLVCVIGLAGCNRIDTEQAASTVQERVSQAGQAIEDAAITTKVKAELAAKKEVDGSGISVSTTHGRVTLSGSAPPTQIAVAEEIARKVEGVKKVDNKLKPAAASS
jgi:hyperosmotically inducible periplasmic protein